MTKSVAEQELEDKDAKKVSVKLTGYESYHFLEGDRVAHKGDVVEVEEGRARALVQQGFAEPATSSLPAPRARSADRA